MTHSPSSPLRQRFLIWHARLERHPALTPLLVPTDAADARTAYHELLLHLAPFFIHWHNTLVALLSPAETPLWCFSPHLPQRWAQAAARLNRAQALRDDLRDLAAPRSLPAAPSLLCALSTPTRAAAFRLVAAYFYFGSLHGARLIGSRLAAAVPSWPRRLFTPSLSFPSSLWSQTTVALAAAPWRRTAAAAILLTYRLLLATLSSSLATRSATNSNQWRTGKRP
ncbi:MAG: hypothetical protein N2557_06550 [Hydrogenophilus sp.]|nr:hypothetical protein [Hydrogenophilus sp.]